MPQRELNLQTINDVLAEIDHLQKTGCTPTGNWDFTQVCNHLAYFAEGSLDGYQFKVPWIFKKLFGRRVLNRIMTQRKMKTGVFTPQRPLPAPGQDAAAAADRLRKALIRVRDHRGEFCASPFFGEMTPDQVRDLAVIHSAHHLAFLQPK